MKRALHRFLCGDAEAKFRENHMEEILQIMQQDKQTLLPKLLDLPDVKKRGALATAAALLANLPSNGLSEGDAAWVKIVNLSLKEARSPDETRDLVHLMSAKGQAEYLARRFDHLRVAEMLGGLETSMVSSIYRALKLQGEGVVTPSAKRRRVVGEAEKQNLVSVAAALMEKLEFRYALGERRTVGIALRDLYTDQLAIQKLADLMINEHQVLELATFADRVELSVASKLLETLAASLTRYHPSMNLLESLSTFAVKIGKRYQKHGELQKASGAFRQAMGFCPNDEGRSRLTDVLLACHGKAGEVDKAELLKLLAEEGRWATLVSKWAALEGTPEKTETWQTEKVDQLAREFEKVGERQTAASLHAKQGLTKEALGLRTEAFEAFRKAYQLGDHEQIAESGIARLAVACGRVQDAATDFLSPVLGGTDEAKQRVHTCFKLLQDYIDHRLGGRGPEMPMEPSIRSPIYDSLFNFGDSQDSDCIIERKPASVVPALVAPPTPMSAPATPLTAAPATPIGQPSNWTQKAGQLREQHPDRVPTICMPALDPNRLGVEPQIDFFRKPWKFLLKEDATGADLKRQIQKRLLESGASTHILGHASEVQPPIGNAELIGHLYERHKRDDCLHLKFTVDKFASGGLRLELFRA